MSYPVREKVQSASSGARSAYQTAEEKKLDDISQRTQIVADSSIHATQRSSTGSSYLNATPLPNPPKPKPSEQDFDRPGTWKTGGQENHSNVPYPSKKSNPSTPSSTGNTVMQPNDIEQDDEKIPLTPGESMGICKLGMTREDLFKTLKLEITPFESCDSFEEIGLRVEYDENNKVTLLESDGTWPLFLDDLDVFSTSASDCIDWIKMKDSSLTESEDGTMFNSEKLGLGLMINELDQPPFLIAIFPKNP